MNAVYDFFIKEWYFSIPLVIMSLIAAALVIWRLLLNNTANTDMDDFLPLFQQTLRKGGVKAAVSLCREEKGLIPSRLFIAGLEASDQGAAAMRRSMANENELEIVPRLHFLLAPILAIAKIATMVGLFFTVISMINTFNAIGEGASSGKAKEIGGHASKIGLALFATALGLFTAIPLVFSHVLFKDWIAKFEIRVKASSQKLITLVTNYKKDPKLLDQPEKEDAEDEDEDDRARRKRKARAD
ncbi:proton channel : Gll1141 protein OS=Gloeobacter violaceus (strain PCC 7421) GN=gll1141 PE=3 SV=1: MotA_ExbB [Gemmata massiliana]|uniref:MotA/TolQ/ExbB proton channel domain-containing protein n=1 Tax=Gemmata massiliana TaxID=1210884 RepID=A0A6P2D1N6_9BACT|nr:MotA/TolQ/ExbB proton channel family protein [Gemmata massiliana]VTR94777.1 proton channel : Gll1141 protein OS=Gloeobacter violaceus (strain PCC 7421) GN=gll1141 PE=3 SV=1: MotA_ExbB [Gemmata massiliana]